jgi:hypothetical protein
MEDHTACYRYKGDKEEGEQDELEKNSGGKGKKMYEDEGKGEKSLENKGSKEGKEEIFLLLFLDYSLSSFFSS